MVQSLRARVVQLERRSTVSGGGGDRGRETELWRVEKAAFNYRLQELETEMETLQVRLQDRDSRAGDVMRDHEDLKATLHRYKDLLRDKREQLQHDMRSGVPEGLPNNF